MGRPARGGVSSLGLALLLAACVAPGSSPDPGAGIPDPASDRLRAQARAALARWADAVAASDAATGFVPVGSLIGQVGDWEAEVGGNNKLALVSGIVVPAGPLPSEAPPGGRIRWPDGTSTPVTLLSASAALEQIRADGVQPCPECRPLRVTAARLTDRPFQTSRGEALVPTWTFTIEGSAVRITRVAVASRVMPAIPPWDPGDPPMGISIETAWLAADGRTLRVGFVGGCDESYQAEAVESELAVVVIVHALRGGSRPCDLVGHSETAEVVLAAPLGDRTVLEVQEGRPVALTRVP